MEAWPPVRVAVSRKIRAQETQHPFRPQACQGPTESHVIPAKPDQVIHELNHPQ